MEKGARGDARLKVGDIRDRSEVRGTFLVRSKTLRTARNGKSYLTMELADRTGSIEARVWDDAERLDGLAEPGVVVDVVGRASTFQGQLQLNVDGLQPVPPEAVVLEDFLPRSAFDLDDMMAGLRNVVEGISDPWYRQLLLALLDDPAFAPRLRVAPAAKVMHHAYLGGLVEHALSMCRVAIRLHEHYERVYPGLLDRDLLVAGAVLHDVGKVLEIGADAAFDYTYDGRLVGHIVQGVELITAKARSIEGFPGDRLAQLKHMIVAHHGKLEFGSPRTPAMAEALLLHFIDMMDARMNGMFTLCRDEAGRPWTRYSRMLETALLNPFAALPVDEAGAPLFEERDEAWLMDRAVAAAGASVAPASSPAEVAPTEAAPAAPKRTRAKRVQPPAEDGAGVGPDDGPSNLTLF